MTDEPEFRLCGMPFYGKAETVTGDLWWFEEDGVRYPLVPMRPTVERPASQEGIEQ